MYTYEDLGTRLAKKEVEKKEREREEAARARPNNAANIISTVCLTSIRGLSWLLLKVCVF